MEKKKKRIPVIFAAVFVIMAAMLLICSCRKADSSRDGAAIKTEKTEERYETHMNISIFSLPEDTVKQLLLVDDTLGVNINFYADASLGSSNSLTYGTHVSVSLIDKHLPDLKDIKDITTDDLNINVSPYLESQFLSGQLHAQATIRLMDFVRERAGHAFALDLGYRTKF